MSRNSRWSGLIGLKKKSAVRRNQTLPHACPAKAGRLAQTPAAQFRHPPCCNRRDDRAIMTQKSQGDVNFRSRAPGFSSQCARGRAAPLLERRHH